MRPLLVCPKPRIRGLRLICPCATSPTDPAYACPWCGGVLWWGVPWSKRVTALGLFLSIRAITLGLYGGLAFVVIDCIREVLR
jgi:hypothetical protein